MTQAIDALADIAALYDVIVFDQWGVLHYGSAPYQGAVKAIASLEVPAAVLSNSGKRAAPNAARITAMGFPEDGFAHVMTSGEALWRDIALGVIPARRILPVERVAGDALAWAEGLDIELVADATEAEAILLMGLPDGAALTDWEASLAQWRAQGLPLYCSNPDRQSPRADGLVISPGALAFRYREMGGACSFYGKPHLPVFKALEDVFGAGRYLMVGDSLEHDIAGAHSANWDSLLVEGGLYAERFASADAGDVFAQITAEKGCAPPTYRIKGLR